MKWFNLSTASSFPFPSKLNFIELLIFFSLLLFLVPWSSPFSFSPSPFYYSLSPFYYPPSPFSFFSFPVPVPLPLLIIIYTLIIDITYLLLTSYNSYPTLIPDHLIETTLRVGGQEWEWDFPIDYWYLQALPKKAYSLLLALARAHSLLISTILIKKNPLNTLQLHYEGTLIRRFPQGISSNHQSRQVWSLLEHLLQILGSRNSLFFF